MTPNETLQRLCKAEIQHLQFMLGIKDARYSAEVVTSRTREIHEIMELAQLSVTKDKPDTNKRFICARCKEPLVLGDTDELSDIVATEFVPCQECIGAALQKGTRT